MGVQVTFIAPSLEELDGPDVSALSVRSSVPAVSELWSVFRWVTKILLSRASPCFGIYVMALVPAALAIISTHQSKLGPRGGLRPVLVISDP
jgi:hypothetical protein